MVKKNSLRYLLIYLHRTSIVSGVDLRNRVPLNLRASLTSLIHLKIYKCQLKFDLMFQYLFKPYELHHRSLEHLL